MPRSDYGVITLSVRERTQSSARAPPTSAAAGWPDQHDRARLWPYRCSFKKRCPELKVTVARTTTADTSTSATA